MKSLCDNFSLTNDVERETIQHLFLVSYAMNFSMTIITLTGAVTNKFNEYAKMKRDREPNVFFSHITVFHFDLTLFIISFHCTVRRKLPVASANFHSYSNLHSEKEFVGFLCFCVHVSIFGFFFVSQTEYVIR